MSGRPGIPAMGKERPSRPRVGTSLTDELLGDILAELRALRFELRDDPPAPTGGRVYIREPAPAQEDEQ